METLRAPSLNTTALDKARRKSILLLTDGQPNCAPTVPYDQGIRNYMDQHPKFKFQMNTFGFGYNLDSALLLQLAEECHGTYSFIPVAPNVGTMFVNTVANIVSNYTQSATLRLLPAGGAQFTGAPKGKLTSSEETWGRFIHLGPLQYGQARDVVIPMKIPAGSTSYLEAIVSYPNMVSGKEVRVSSSECSHDATLESVVAGLRNTIIDTGFEACQEALANNMNSANKSMETLNKLVDTLYNATGKSPKVQALQADTSERMSKAFDGNERFRRWGGHYIRSLMRAH